MQLAKDYSQHANAGIDNSSDEVILVDARDREIGRMGKLEAHQRGRLHRAFSVFIVDSASRLLLQQRAPNKYHSAGLWSNTCCSHPRPGEPVAAAADRRLGEEMGFISPLSFLFSTSYCEPVSGGLVEHELVHVFGGHFEGTPRPDPSEVMAWAWREPADIAAEVTDRPGAYTVWFEKYWRQAWMTLQR